ncbi:serine/threonine-protein kinase [Hyalangium sp.]|uniref:serine/threonine protein kinase n=1 Tax=Hyalangium sp. TaxID=2028555 RepID=UPI002D23D2B3|nr:serine/threonine-protein kinase [Hyalangium sp.]HYI01469.1 serine/threonine-protein kinase [Hyalangium sp.]
MVAQVDPLDLKPGQMVDGWRIVRRIGRGGYAVVYEVEKDGQRFALKVACQTERSRDPRQVDARAMREVACLQQLRHRHIIRMWAHGRWPDPRSGFLYIVLDFVDGYTLARWVEQTHPTPHEVVVLFRKLFEALEHMHGRDVFHRDLSLRNIMVTQEGEPVIIDFGAADYAAAEELTDGPLPPGTPRNRSPEAQRFWNENRLNPEARYKFKATDDIFALGANLYDVLTDPMPTRGEKRPPLGNEVMEPPTPFKATQGRVPQELSRYAMKLIHHTPEERHATAKDARGPLEEFSQFQGPEWRSTRVHPVASQLPPEPAEGAPVPAEARQAEGPHVPIPFHPLPVQVPPAPSAAGAAAQSRPRRAWLRPVFVGPLALLALAAAVAAFVLHRPAEPAPPPVAQSAPAAQPPPASALAEKPTSRPTQLPSPLPTQKEASPSVKQPDTSPTLTNGVPHPQQAQKASKRRVLSKAQRCALLVASVAWFQAGCLGVQSRPNPEDCPEGAVKVMKELGWRIESNRGPAILMDVTKGSDEVESFAVFKDGHVTGELIRPEGKAPVGMLLEGHLWTTGDKIYGRYVRAHLPGGRTVPICLELQDGGGRLGVDKAEGSKPGHTVGNKAALTMARERWR